MRHDRHKERERDRRIARAGHEKRYVLKNLRCKEVVWYILYECNYERNM